MLERKKVPKVLNKQITLTFNPRIFHLERIHPKQVVTHHQNLSKIQLITEI